MARGVTLSLLAALPVLLAGRPCGPPTENNRFRYDKGDVFYEKRVRNKQQCYNLCWSTNPCVAVNFCTKTRICFLLSKKAPRHTDLSVYFNYVYGEVLMAMCKSYISPCDTRPCKNRATCVCSSNKYSCIPTRTPRNQCGKAPSLPHASVVVKTTMRDAVAEYKCDAGYKFHGAVNTNMCKKRRERRGKWRGLRGSCKKIACSDPAQVADADVGHGVNDVGSTRTITCRRDNAIKDLITCLQNGTWSGLALVCPGLNSTKQSFDKDGSGNSSSLKDGSGKSSSNTSLTTSQQTGGSGISLATETPAVDCGRPPEISGGVVRNGSSVVGSERTYTCVSGRQGIGQPKVHCLENGTWSVTDFTCQVRCGEHRSVPPNATYTTLNATAVEFQCMEGYIGQGEKRSTCQDNGTWSAVNFTCKPIDCGKPPDIKNANVSNTGTEVGGSATYTCSEGYEGTGSFEIVCQKDGEWTNSSFKCSLVHCVDPPDIPHIKNMSGPWNYSAEVELICTGKTHPSGKNKATCDAKGKWKHDGFKCTEREPRVLVAVKDTKSFHTIEVDSRRTVQLNFSGYDSIQDVDYCPVTNNLYWVEPDVIRYANLDDGQPHELMRQNGTGGFVRVDGNAKLLFYAVRGTKTNLTKLNLPTEKRTLLHTVETPLALEIDTTNRLVYWAEWMTKKQVMKMGYDGSGLESVVQLGPCDLGPWAVHVDQNKNLYWSVNDEVHIRQADEDNNGTVLQDFASICDGIRTLNERMFVSCTNDSTVRVHVNGSEAQPLSIGDSITGEKFITVIP